MVYENGLRSEVEDQFHRIEFSRPPAPALPRNFPKYKFSGPLPDLNPKSWR